ncbi:MAG: patatin-like phospholipase family protein [Bacteroidales bacterium]|nr:patatin-like phospholipase family protein [Bacteroidales bacterium]MBN2758208.1 patatin-like phospholipase family protein [Bacteroidales bacterium]
MKTPVSLVLSSGSARGMAHIGVIEALEENGFEIKEIAGCSIGALIGGVYAAGKLQYLKEWLCNLHKIDVFKLMDFSFGSQGFIKGNKVFNEVNKFIKDINIEDLKIPFSAVAVDINKQEEYIFRNGNLQNAIRASVAIPNVIQPFKYNNSFFVDGGVLNPLPINLLNHNNKNLLVVVDLNSLNIIGEKIQIINKTPAQEKKEQKSILKSIEFKERWDKIFPNNKKEKEKETEKLGYLTILNRSFDMMQNKISKQAINEFKPDILIEISKSACNTFDFYKADEMIALGKSTCNKVLAEYKLKK